MARDKNKRKEKLASKLPEDVDSHPIGFVYKTMIERDPKKRRVKPQPLLDLVGDFGGEESDDEDYVPKQELRDDDDDDDDDDIDDDGDESDERQNGSDSSSDEGDSDEGAEKESEVDEESASQTGSDSLLVAKKLEGKSSTELKKPVATSYLASSESRFSKVKICSVCLGDVSYADDEIVECDSCCISVHEGCYGISNDDDESVKSNVSSASTEPWFCDPCKAGVRNPYCELCPNTGGIFKETDVGRWVHIVCALYCPGVAFADVNKLQGITLFEMPYDKWGARPCSLCEDERLTHTGVCVECDAGMCRTWFHVTCAQREGLLTEAPSGEEADPFFAYCKLHCDKFQAKQKRRNWLALQSKFRANAANSAPLQNERILNKLEIQRQKFRTASILSRRNAWVPPQKMPRQITTSPSAMKRLIRKAELLGLSPQGHVMHGHEVIDVRKKWHVPPAFSLEFVSYYLDRNQRMITMEHRNRELVQQNAQLKDSDNRTLLKYEEVLHSVNSVKEEVCQLKGNIMALWTSLNRLSKKPLPLPHILERMEREAQETERQKFRNQMPTKKIVGASKMGRPSKSSANSISDVSPDISPIIKLHKCGKCKQSKDQHLMALCDQCLLHYHLYCLDPPLSRMPKKTRFGGWMCSECTEKEATDENSDEEASKDASLLQAPRRLREKIKEPSKFIPDEEKDAKELSKDKKRKRKKYRKRRPKDHLKADSTNMSMLSEMDSCSAQSGPGSNDNSVRGPLLPPKKKPKMEENQEETCAQCSKKSSARQQVQCDDCKKWYHFSCLDPPRKKTPKQRGYKWYCERCDVEDSDEEDEEDQEETPTKRQHKKSKKLLEAEEENLSLTDDDDDMDGDSDDSEDYKNYL